MPDNFSRAAAAALALCIALVAGCSRSQNHTTMSPEPLPTASGIPGAAPFFSAEEHPESPKPPAPTWRGILLAGPDRVNVRRQPLVILRGTYRLAGSNYPADDRLTVVAVNTATRQQWSGAPGQEDPSPDAPPPATEPPDRETLSRMIFSGHFNFGLFETLRMPPAPGTYKVWVQMGPLKSNEITLQVVSE